jgi:tRNA A37 threonylcarbamoyltransferase TsaD
MGHVFSILVVRSRKILQLPYVCLTVSGGHNDIYLITGTHQTAQIAEGVGTSYHKRRHLVVGEAVQVGPYQVRKLGQTIDDAAGEAFDKVARMLGGPYPGGAWIDRLALQGNANKQIDLTTTFLSADSYDVSFSGIKSQVHYLLGEKDPASLSDQYKADIAWKFEDQVTHVLTKKLVQAAIDHQAQTV